jgi:hypothetical protein
MVPPSVSRNNNNDADYNQEIPAVMTIPKAVPSVLQVVIGHAVQLPHPKGGQDGAI